MQRISSKVIPAAYRFPTLLNPILQRGLLRQQSPFANHVPESRAKLVSHRDLYKNRSVSGYQYREPLKTTIFAECVDGKIEHPPLLNILRSIHPVLGESATYSFPRNMGLEPVRMLEEIQRQHKTLFPRFTIVAPHTKCAGDPVTPVAVKMNDLAARVSDSVQKSGEPHMILGGKIWGGHKRFNLKRVIVSDLAPLKSSKTPGSQAHLEMYITTLDNIRKRFHGVKIEMLDAQGNVTYSERTAPRKVSVKNKKPHVRMPKRTVKSKDASKTTSSGNGTQRPRNEGAQHRGNSRSSFQDKNKMLGPVNTNFLVRYFSHEKHYRRAV